MLLAFRKRRRAAASAALEPFAMPSDEELAGWLAHVVAPDSFAPEAVPESARRHPYAAHPATTPAPLEVRA
ncbi:hypothetical protein [Nonomuraea sp. JJY05]|uniref:hypothetical protein n=1 Tax=Nonomuraea sp. JJY05 TaxID=3350255 RepID=UPI00373F1177